MKKLLKLLFESKYADFLGFKGGTLAYLCYGLDRFSTDIDLDLLDASQEEGIISFLDSELPLLATVKQMVVGKDLHRRKLSYHDEARNIKIELNKRHCPYTRYETKDLDGLTLQCQTPSSMATNKLLALGNRR